MTEKENYLMLVKGEEPEWVPRYAYAPSPDGKPTPMLGTGPGFLREGFMSAGPSKDIFGVTYVPVREAGGAKLPEPNNFIL